MHVSCQTAILAHQSFHRSRPNDHRSIDPNNSLGRYVIAWCDIRETLLFGARTAAGWLVERALSPYLASGAAAFGYRKRESANLAGDADPGDAKIPNSL